MKPIRSKFSVLALILVALVFTVGNDATRQAAVSGETAKAQWPDIIEAKKIAEDSMGIRTRLWSR